MPTYIRFDRDHDLEVTEEVAVVADAIAAAGESPIPLISLTRNNGRPVLVNARSIRTLTASTRGKRAGFD